MDTTAVHFIFMLFCIVQEYIPRIGYHAKHKHIHKTIMSTLYCSGDGIDNNQTNCVAGTYPRFADGLQTQGNCTVTTKTNMKKQQIYA